MSPGLSSYLPMRAWAAVLALAVVAMGSLLLPPSVGESVGLSFRPFFWIVAGIQLGCAVGIGAVVVYYRRPPEERAEGDREWRYDP
ncbi:hypothetical protein BRC93_14910 [Halobacteriales archaeon QS_5_70_15]|jgi:hypothetical protein|nr:MAG: hypothetical protein BRC93_14910 [Halobacteriales archaeon QS_5_70_15]